MSNPALPHGVERRRQFWRFNQPESAEKNSLTKIACNPLIRLVSDERIQGNPRKSNVQKLGFSYGNSHGPRKSKLALSSLRRCGVLPLRRAVGIGNLVGVAGDEIVLVVDFSRGLERLVHISRAALVGEHPA
jgi:hypothetical protein